MAKLISLSEASVIGFHAMVLIASSKEGLNVQTISEKTGSSKHHIVKIMQRLAKSNYLTSSRGPNGGFVLTKKPSEITLLQIYECIEGSLEMAECPVNHDLCPFEKCIMNGIPQMLTNQIKDYLKGQTLEDFKNSLKK